MKKLLLSFVFFTYTVFCFAQEQIKLNFDLVKKEVTDKTDTVKFNTGKTYQIKIKGLNTSYISSKLESEAYYLSSTIPDVLKGILPGIPESFLKTTFAQYSTVYDQSVNRYEKLRHLKAKSDSLYKWTKNKPNIKISKEVLNQVIIDLDVKNIDALKERVNLDFQFIASAYLLFNKKIQTLPINEIVDNQLLDMNANLAIMNKDLNSDNYLRYVSFIEKSTKAKDFIKSKPFKAEKDLVDLNILFIDTYAKDTLYNSAISFYTNQKWSFDFSTGFFYNNLVEESYYTTKRDTLINNINKESSISYDIAIGALAHLSYKFYSNFKLGVSLGIAISPLDTKARYLFGGSIILGRKKQVAFNGGLAIAKLKVLSDGVKNDGQGDFVPAEITEVPTDEKLLNGYYLAVSYNLNKVKKK